MPRSAVRVSKKKILSTSPKSHFASAPGNFVSSFYAKVLPSDLELFSAHERGRIAASIWTLASHKRPGEIKVRVYNPSPQMDGWTVDHTVIEIVVEDMPFLIDSIIGALQNRGLAVHVIIHPVIGIRRDSNHKATGIAKLGTKDGVAEAFMHIESDHCFDGEQLNAIEEDIRSTLTDVSSAVKDWQPMRRRMQEACDEVAALKGVEAEEKNEIQAFLRWLIDDNFTFLGYREIDLNAQVKDGSSIHVVPKSGLGILRKDELRMFGGLRDMNKQAVPALRKYLQQDHVLFITKTHAVTRVHRVLPMDAIFVRHLHKGGKVVSEKLFVGLFTSRTYTQSPQEIPFMRRKIAAVIDKMSVPPKSHDRRTLLHILSIYPHDELFQISPDELYTNVLGILQLQERARVALFMRRDPFDRYVTLLIYIPRDRYDSVLRRRIYSFLEEAFAGKMMAWHVRLDDSLLARIFATVRLTQDAPHVDPVKLEKDLRELCRTWSGRLRDSLVTVYGEATALVLLRRYGDAFSESYRDAVSPAGAVRDIRNLERVRHTPGFIVNIDEIGDGRLRLKLLQPERPLLLSESLPLIENMGLKIDYMGGPYDVKFRDSHIPIFIHEFVGKPALPLCTSFDNIKPVFEEALAKVWSGEIENDPFNALTLRIGLDWRAVVVLRACARYLRQLRIPYSQEMIASALVAHPKAAQEIYALFYLRHDPNFKGDRREKMRLLEEAIAEELINTNLLEEDRVIRRYLNLVQSSLRTNYFQTDTQGKLKPYISIKFDSRTVDFMPLPKPLFEIFVYSPSTEAIHLRGGRVARGGIRWSDRREDFRSEVLGLMKAQMVKNSVIVPVGSKGGFVVKRPPLDPERMRVEGIACYETMISGLLDITDNIKNGKVVPANAVRYDGDDTYLVVAADKGTAQFSDIANNLSQTYGFWLDDAFASGGSTGYDHKGMAITARGAWEAVKRHFRELNKDIQAQDFTCIGIGDMSGDVFGNAMLLSRHVQLIGAFDHRHIFCDPHPDVATSYKERKRLFDLPRSSWNDYERKSISKGGGIFARSEKSIKISQEMKKVFGITADTLAPADLIQAMLRAEVELLYFGGIGTYVKASDETQEEAGDRTNDALRINGDELKAKVVGEGANLGMTQRGRIDYALTGGRLNTDAIDNSGGVDTSDHEVNIKVLLRKSVDSKKLSLTSRNELLASMTEEIGDLVLRDNYLQTQIMSAVEHEAFNLLSVHGRCIQILEKSGLLNRVVEYLPNEAEIAERQRESKGLTRPELAVVMAYAKIWLDHKMLDSALPEDQLLQSDLTDYFPVVLRKTYAKDIAQHPLHREIAATVVTNDIVNHTGPRIILMMADKHNPEAVIRAYLLAREAFSLPQLWSDIEALDTIVPAALQIRMFAHISTGLLQVIEHILAAPRELLQLQSSIKFNRQGLIELKEWFKNNTAVFDADMGQGSKISQKEAKGVPAHLLEQVNTFSLLVGALDLIELAAKQKMAISDLASIFFGIEKRLKIGWLSQLARQTAQTPWQREAIFSELEVLASHHRRLTFEVAACQAIHKGPYLEAWFKENAAKLEGYDALVKEWQQAQKVDLATLLLANERLAAL